MTQENGSDALTTEIKRQALQRILKSTSFSRAVQQLRFLQFSVDNTIDGNFDELKEQRIGVAVYERKKSYSPGTDSIVRTEANRLRKKLKEYYSGEGKYDPVVISIEQGSYVATFSASPDIADASKTSSQSQYIVGGITMAVIPFEDFSGRPEAADCARGITEELIHALMKTEGLRVAAAGAVAPLVKQTIDLKSIAEKLAVQTLIEGSVRLEGNRLRVLCRLVNSEGFQLWSHRFDIAAEHPQAFAVQEQIASTLANWIGPQLSQVRDLNSTFNNFELLSYSAVLTGLSLLEASTTASRAAALSKFREQTIKAPKYARVFSGYAQSLVEMTIFGELPLKESLPEAQIAINRAKELDSRSMEVFDAAALVECLKLNWKEAVKNFQSGISLGAHPGLYRDYATILCALGRVSEAEQNLNHAQKIDPFSKKQMLASTRLYFLSRQYEKVIQYSKEQNKYGGLSGLALLFEALAYIQLKQFDKAKSMVSTSRSEFAGEPFAGSVFAEILFAAGAEAEAESIVQELECLPEQMQLSFNRRCLLSLSKGEVSEAFALLEQSFQAKEPGLIWIKMDPRYDAFKGRVDFKTMIDTIFG